MRSLRLQRSTSVCLTRIRHCAPTGIRQFYPQTISASSQFRFLWRCNLKTLSQHSYSFSCMRVDGAYKRKAQRVQPVDSSFSDGSKQDGSNNWKTNAIKKKTPIFDSNNKYTQWLIPKFTSIAKGARLTPEQLGKMIIRDGMISEEKEILTEMLYN